MASIIDGIGPSHVPTIGVACGQGRQQEPLCKRLVDGYTPLAGWSAEQQAGVLVSFCNDHCTTSFSDLSPSVASGVGKRCPVAMKMQGCAICRRSAAMCNCRCLLPNVWSTTHSIRLSFRTRPPAMAARRSGRRRGRAVFGAVARAPRIPQTRHEGRPMIRRVGDLDRIGGTHLFVPRTSNRALRSKRFLWHMIRAQWRHRFLEDSEALTQEAGLTEHEKALIRARDRLGPVQYGASVLVVVRFARSMRMIDLQVCAITRGESFEDPMQTRRVPDAR